MLSSSLIVFVMLKLLSARALSQFFNRRDRIRLKEDLLLTLKNAGQLSAADITSKTTRAVIVFLEQIGGKTPFSPSYVARCVGAGLFSVAIVIGLCGLFLSQEPVDIFRSVVLWKMVFAPILISAAVFAPFDIGIAHLLARQSKLVSSPRFAVIALTSVVIGYGLWCAGTALVAVLGPLISGGYFSWSFFLNRFALALQNPVQSVGSLSTSSAYVSYHLMSLSLALTCALLAVTAALLYIIGFLPEKSRHLLAAPLFGVLSILNALEHRGVDIGIKPAIYGMAVILLLFAGALKAVGA